jgi:hypothetical protein
MIKVAAALNSFASEPEATAPPSEEIFVLTSSQLRQIIAEAIKPLNSKIEGLEGTITELTRKVSDLETTQDTQAENQLIQLRLIGQLREATAAPVAPVAGSKTLGRIEKIRAILKARGGTASFKELRRELGLKPNQFSALVAKLDKRIFQVLINPRARDEKALRLRAFT